MKSIEDASAATIVLTAFAAFETVVQGAHGFRNRPGQYAMAQRVAETLSHADLGKTDAAVPHRNIAVIQAGTGVGKSAAYASTAIATALARKTRVIISTATVALQEQLMHKDLPLIASLMPTPFTYVLAKGRGRYVCKLKLERLGGHAGTSGFLDDLFDDGQTFESPSEAVFARRSKLSEGLAVSLANGSWNGDRDALATQPQPSDWSLLAADRHSCTVKHCPHYQDCSYYQARNQMAKAQVIVANHDLVLASIGRKTLPELDNCLIIFDEGHHLPAVALDQFSNAMDITSLRWLDRLPKVVNDAIQSLQLPLGVDLGELCSQLKVALQHLSRLSLDMVHAHTKQKDGHVRFSQGVLHPTLLEPLEQIALQSKAVANFLVDVSKAIKACSQEEPQLAVACAQAIAKIGGLAQRLDSVASTSALLLEQGDQPLAKWLECKTEGDGRFLNLSAHACPIVPGDLLRQFLWSQVRAAVVTSATLSSCGSFDYFLDEAGLSRNPVVTTLAVESPFDYAEQGVLQIRGTGSDPKNAAAYTTEMVAALIVDLQDVQRGALVLFTSRAQMQHAVDALTPQLHDCVWVQGSQSRTQLLASHTARVESGQRSIIFGMQSFGEGLDLPGDLCAHLFIAKLPFSPPSDPVDEARAEWLRSIGRDPFTELVIPATAMKLLQWTGRAIRTETDQATVTCYDKRLTDQSYGRRILAGLPPYRLLRSQIRSET